jgi:2-hydroxycyclohexanecarboxyl-CoA dehydrogenase
MALATCDNCDDSAGENAMTVKVALVTGAAAGIGAACAKRLAKDGMAVGVLDLDEERCADTVEAIRDAGGIALALGADVSKRDQVFAAVEKLRGELGPITVLVNNAGVTDFTPFEQITDELWDFVYAVNVRGPMIVTQAVLPDMKAAHWGRVVNISSSSAQTGALNMITYSSSKGAIVTMTRSMAQEFGPYGITVNNIPPGSVMGTIMSEANKHRFQRPENELLAAIPVGRRGEPNDIANACSWLCSEGTGYFTGQTVGVNGGRVVS